MSEDLATKKMEAVKAAIANLDKQFGKGTVMTSEGIPDMEFLKTGCYSLDKITGGGLPKGRIVEIYGPESSGKTTLALHAIAEVQKNGGIAAFVDAEHALDVRYARALGVDPDALVLSQPDNGEQALEVTEQLVRSGGIDIIVIDSVAALVPQKEIEGDMGDAQMGRQALLMSQAMRKLTGICSKTGTVIIFINQLRMKIGLVFGNPETTTGGNALKFYASLRLDIRRSGVVKSGTGDEAEAVGSKTVVKVVKNKVFPPFKDCEFTIRYGHGIDKESDILNLAVVAGVVEKKGAWYAFNGKNIGQGEEKTLEALRTDSQLREEIVSLL